MSLENAFSFQVQPGKLNIDPKNSPMVGSWN